ncbi:MAG: Rpn family recombination-promoting nuclease/putative transposase [Clostridiales Family XIII bacterium]|jgi:hypothetical protein|nr:Rpn family recombination-promoting nuclease/putative transposase [Clostridiales Family XIII bacterium]
MSKSAAKANKKHKDSVFSSYLGEPNKLIEIYNAVMNTNYPLDTELEINTLDDALFKNRQNDISFLLDGRLIVMFEHQSTTSQNLPIRLLMYLSREYEKIVAEEAIYHEKLVPIPEPLCIVFYNGIDKMPAKWTERLSDAYLSHETGDQLDLEVTIYNINPGADDDILGKSRALYNYSFLIYKIREYHVEGITLEDAIIQAIDYCMSHDIMKEYLKNHASEVRNMLYTEWNQDTALKVRFEEGREDGLEQGLEQGLDYVVVNLIKEGYDDNVIMAGTKKSLAEIQAIRKRLESQNQ